MAPLKVILLACGSFNPPTNMHLRMFEIAKDNLNKMGNYQVIGGLISPVHDSYGKKELVAATYRCEMLKLALQSSNWIRVSDWECKQESWCRTRQVLQYHQNLINAIINDSNMNSPERRRDKNSWIQDVENVQGPVQIKLLCGADLLESFSTPGLWSDEDIEAIIGEHGLVVITRHGSNPQKFIYESDTLTRYMRNIIIVPEWITNEVSSTKIRRALRRHESVKYLISDAIIDFIKKNGLYGTSTDFEYVKHNENLNIPNANFMLTPSPSDVLMSCSPISSQNIILNLNSLDDMNSNVTETDYGQGSKAVFIKPDDSNFGMYDNLETFQSRAEIKFTADKNEENFKRSHKVIQTQSKVVQYPGQAVQVVTEKKLEDEAAKIKKGMICRPACLL